jgi:hypothetical protein
VFGGVLDVELLDELVQTGVVGRDPLTFVVLLPINGVQRRTNETTKTVNIVEHKIIHLMRFRPWIIEKKKPRNVCFFDRPISRYF